MHQDTIEYEHDENNENEHEQEQEHEIYHDELGKEDNWINLDLFHC